MSKLYRDCKHGQLARQCPHCENETMESEIETLRAQVARQRAWIDGVMGQESTVSEYYDTIGRRHFTRFGETAEQIGYECRQLITRPAPFEDK